jgi:hypothetical protein
MRCPLLVNIAINIGVSPHRSEAQAKREEETGNLHQLLHQLRTHRAISACQPEYTIPAIIPTCKGEKRSSLFMIGEYLEKSAAS